jgi:uncharacterized protein (DUF488 family)
MIGAATGKPPSRGTKETPLPASENPLFTIGHSSLEAPEFARLLARQRIELVIDVRSQPSSGRFPHFNAAPLEKLLESAGIAYLFLGEELGGRPNDPDVYGPDGVVDYRARRKSYAFNAGLERLEREMETRRTALMCAEEDPIECHRFLMICPDLAAREIKPQHLRKDGSVETQQAAEDRLLRSTGFADVAANTLFPEARAEALEKALELQARKCAFRVDPNLVGRW